MKDVNQPIAFISKSHRNEQCKTNINEFKWYIDSGLSGYMCNSEKLFSPSKVKSPTKWSIHIGDEMKLDVKYVDSISGQANVFWKQCPIILENVLYVQYLKYSWFSVRVIQNRGYTIKFATDKYQTGICKINDDKSKYLSFIGVEVCDGLYEEIMKPNQENNLYSSLSSTISSEQYCIWDKRLEHSSRTTIFKSIQITKGISL